MSHNFALETRPKPQVALGRDFGVCVCERESARARERVLVRVRACVFE